MRVRIIRRPPPVYGTDGESLHVGRVYNLDSSLASALLADGCAELYELLTQEQRREQTEPDGLWEAADRNRRRAPLFRIAPDPVD
jgi:hypothetical protein